MAGEVTSVTVVENVLFNLTITEDDATVTTVQVPSEIATIEINAFDVNVDMNNLGSGLGVFRAKSIDTFSLRSISDDNKTIEVSLTNNDDEITIKIPDAGLEVPDNFTLNADSDDTANVKFVGSTVDISKAKLITELDANSQNITSAGTITATQGDITTVNATNLNSTNIDVDAGTIDTFTAVNLDATDIDATQGDITTVNATDVNSTNLDVDTGTIDTLTSTNATITTGAITTVNATDVNTTNATITTVNATDVNVSDDLVVTDDASVGGDLAVTQNVQIGQTISVFGDATFNEDITQVQGKSATLPTLTSTTATITTGTITTGNISTANVGNLNVSDDVVVTGDLTVNGTTTTINTETLELADNNIVLNSNHTGTPTQDAGFTVERGTSDDAVFQWNESDDRFEVKVGTGYSGLKTSDLTTTNLTATQGDITTVNATAVNSTNATITTGGIATVNATTVNSTDVNSTNLDVDTGTIDDLTSVDIDATTGDITTVNSTNVNSTNLDVDTGTVDDLTVVTAEATDKFIGNIRGAVTFRAKAGEDLTKGQAVYISGISGNTPVVSLARANSESTMPAYGLVFADASNNANVEIVEFGDLKGLDTATNSLQLDKPVYVSAGAAGELTATRPTGATHLVQNIGLVNRVHASTGAIKVGGSGRTNDVPNSISILGDIATTANVDSNYSNVTLDLAVGRNAVVTGDLTVNGATAIDNLTGVERLTVEVTNASTTDGDGILLWDGNTNYQSTQNNQDDVVHDGGTAPDGQVVYITNSSIEMSDDIKTAGGSDGTVLQAGSIALEKAGGTTSNILLQPGNSSMDGTLSVGTELKPINTEEGSLGTIGKVWGDAYLKDVRMNSLDDTSGGSIELKTHIIPVSHKTLDLGSDTKSFRSVYVGDGSLYIDGHKVLGSDASGQIDITTDDDQNLNISAGAAGTSGTITLSSAGNTTQINDTTVNLGPQIGGATVSINGTLEAPDLHVGDLELDATLINNTGSNANLEIRTNGTGYTHLNTADVYVGTLSNALKIDETTLDLIGATELTIKKDLKVEGQLDVQDVLKVSDGFTLESFDPYGPGGLPSTAMPTTIAGVGQEEGWGAMTIRSRGEHAWGLTGFGIPNEPPRAILAMQAGRLDGSSDDYLNSADIFGHLMFNPYSGYKTGTEWLTPSAEIRAIATEDHSTSGMGSKLEISTTENTNKAGATDASHTNATVTIQGTTISSSGTLIFDDAVEITEELKVGVTGKTTEIGAYTTSSGYNVNGLEIDAGDTSWAMASFKEFEGGANKPVSGFTNPGFATEVFGGTPSSPAALSTGKRVFAMTGTAADDSSGEAPPVANIRILGVTTEQQSTSARGAQVEFQTIPNGSSGPEVTFTAQGNELVIGSGSDGKIRSNGGNLILDDDVEVTGTLDVTGNATFDGNVTLGNANSDVVTSTGKLKASNGFNFTVLDTATANYLGGVLQIVETGDAAYISDGDSGNPCIGVWSGSSWKRIALGSDISSS